MRPPKPCDNWRTTRLCCQCKRPLSKGQWCREGMHIVTARTVLLGPDGSVVGQSLLHHRVHRACSEKLTGYIEEMVAAEQRATWN